jgi:hypothetical protein
MRDWVTVPWTAAMGKTEQSIGQFERCTASGCRRLAIEACFRDDCPKPIDHEHRWEERR